MDGASWEHLVQASQAILDANRVLGLIPRENSGSYIRASNGFGFTPENLTCDQDPFGRRNMLCLALASALVLVDFSNLTGGDFGRCSDELIAAWFHSLMSRQSIGKGGVFLSGKHLFNFASIIDSKDLRMICIKGDKFAGLYSSVRGRDVNVIANIRENVRLVVVADSGLLTFPSSKSGSGEIVQINSDIKYPDDASWKKLEMLVVGGTVVRNFTQSLRLTRVEHRAEMVLNPATGHTGSVAREGWRKGGLDLPDPYFEQLFDENHVALVFMMLCMFAAVVSDVSLPCGLVVGRVMSITCLVVFSMIATLVVAARFYVRNLAVCCCV